MNLYSFASTLFAFGTFFIGLLIWFKRNDAIGRVYFVFSALTAVWALGFALMIDEHTSYSTALLSARIADSSALFVPGTWLHLSLLISGDYHRRKKFLFCVYAIGVLIFFFAFTPLFILKVKPFMNFVHWLRPGPVFHLFTALFFIVVPYAFVNLYQKIKRAETYEKFQLWGFFWASAIGFVGGTLTFLPNYEIQIPQYNIFLMPIYPFITAYFLIRHQLFDVEQAAKVFQREKLATIGLLAASVNHEIRNPLYAAQGILENFKEDINRKSPTEVTDKALSQINRALDVITKLNRFAKPINETIQLNSEASIQEAVQNVLELISYEFELDRIKIINQISNDLSPIQADQRQLEEILFNLIVNACHAMENGGTLVIASEAKQSRKSGLPRRPYGTPRNDELIQIMIQDTGTGISKDQMKHLFEPFHTTKGEKGTGLGLYITKQLVERNGGKILVKSEPEEGTHFILEFRAV